MTQSEEFVLKLSRHTFLSPWSIGNPRGKEAGKELCDVLVVCDPDVIIISVKEIEYKATDDISTGMDRWTSRAVKGSIKQVHGAERLLRRLDQVTAADGAGWLHLPPRDRRRVHRIAVALGSRGEIPITAGDSGKGFVHVLDEAAVLTLMRELDTISDLVEYLRKTEEFLEKTQVVVPGLENLLALYLHRGRNYPSDADRLLLTADMWSEVSAKEEFQRKKEADKVSYLWDGMIEHIAETHDPELTQSHGENDDPNPAVERVTRIMAREPRFNRRMLSKAFQEFHVPGKSRSRIVRSPSGVVYVFLARPGGDERQLRKNELLGRMFIARGLHQDATTVVGIATEEYVPGAGSSLDVANYQKDTWTNEDQALMEHLQRETGAFVSPVWSEERFEEYPEG